jgi:hypothetical protein
MKIKSDKVDLSCEIKEYKTLNLVHKIISIIISLMLIAMSTNNMEGNIILLSSIMIINIVLYNIVQTHQTLEEAQQLEDNVYEYILLKRPITGPIGFIFSIITLIFLITGNLFGWQVYLVYIMVTFIIAKTHKERLGVVSKGKL